jgi:hypothetical protein|nr:MAG TPA: Large polyvalent protein associated domain 29 [Caudoviricetes sp.]
MQTINVTINTNGITDTKEIAKEIRRQLKKISERY